MKQLFKKEWLRVGMIVAVMTTAFAGTAWAEDVTATLTKFTAASGKVDPFVTYSTTGALKTITVSGLDCESVAFSLQFNYPDLTIQSVTVTYTAPVFPYTVTAEVNEEGWEQSSLLWAMSSQPSRLWAMSLQSLLIL